MSSLLCNTNNIISNEFSVQLAVDSLLERRETHGN